jgi:membrane protease YdiL (CAAX protease family)
MTDAIDVKKPWWKKVLEFPLVAMVIAVAVMIGTVGLASAAVKFGIPGLEHDTFVIMVDLAAVAGLFLAYKLVIRHLGRTKRDDLALDGAAKETVAGIGIGVGLFTLIVGVAALIGIYTITGRGDFSMLGSALVTDALFPAVSEEMLFRGVLFRWIEEFGGSWLALAVTSALFGAAHLMNPNASPIAAIGIALEAGVMLGAAYMLTRRLWLAMGLHAGWNFTQGEIWDIPVSGLDQHGVVQAQLQGNPLLTGNGFGLEASLIAIVVATAFGLFLLNRAIKAGRLVRPMWSRPSHPAVDSGL